MSNRRRPRRGSRPTGRPPAQPAVRIPRPRTPGIPPSRPPVRASGGTVTWVLVGLAAVAEAGHLVSGYVEWPAATARGIYHVVAGALLGLVAAVLLLVSQAVTRAWGRAAGTAVALSGPVLWLGGVQVGVSPYAVLPAAAAAGITATEITLAALFLFLPARS